jgi:hypothetical protein
MAARLRAGGEAGVFRAPIVLICLPMWPPKEMNPAQAKAFAAIVAAGAVAGLALGYLLRAQNSWTPTMWLTYDAADALMAVAIGAVVVGCGIYAWRVLSR